MALSTIDLAFADNTPSAPSIVSAMRERVSRNEPRIPQLESAAPDDWAMEAFAISRADAYGNPPLSKSQPQHLGASYVTQAEKDVSLQLRRAGIRLASLLNKTLGTGDGDWTSCLHASQNQQAQGRVSKHRHSRTAQHKRRTH